MATCSDCLGMVRSEPVEGERAVRLVEYVELCPRHASVDALEKALGAFVGGYAWKYLSCCKDGPTQDCPTCGRYFDAIAALSAAKGGKA